MSLVLTNALFSNLLFSKRIISSEVPRCLHILYEQLKSHYYLPTFSQLWLPTVQDVLHADWQDVWHSPHPPFFMDSFKSLVVNVLICFIT